MATKAAVGGVVIAALIGALTGSLVMRSATPETPSADVAALESELFDLRTRLRTLEARPAEPGLATTARPVEDQAVVEQAKRIDALELALQKTRMELAMRSVAEVEGGSPAKERPEFADMDTEELLAAVRKMVAKRAPPFDSEGIVAATAVLLSRGLETDQRAEALIMRGIGLRGTDDVDAERAAFEEARKLAGPDSKRGREARVQVAWTDSRHGRPLAAAAGFLEIAEHPSSDGMQRGWNRYRAAEQFEKAGKLDRVRDEYQRVVRDFGDARGFGSQRIVGMARAALERVESGR